METPKCETCSYWDKGSDATKDCKRFPPILTVLAGSAQQMSPMTKHNDWCGEHPGFKQALEDGRADELLEGARNLMKNR